MRNGYDKYHESLIMYLVNDPVITDANALSFSACKLFDSYRFRLFGKSPYSRNDSIPIRLCNSRQLFLGTPFYK
jgi:hypothetical protein